MCIKRYVPLFAAAPVTLAAPTAILAGPPKGVTSNNVVALDVNLSQKFEIGSLSLQWTSSFTSDWANDLTLYVVMAWNRAHPCSHKMKGSELEWAKSTHWMVENVNTDW